MQILKYIFTVLFFSNSFCTMISDWSVPNTVVEGKEAHLAITQDGKEMIFIIQDKNQKIYSVSSINNGRNWLKSKTFIGKGFNPTIALSKDGKLAICAWEDFNTNNILSAYSLNLGQNWSDASSNPLGKGYFPSICINEDGKIALCVWEDSFSDDLCIAYSINQGQNWTLESYIDKARSPSVAVSESGNEVVCIYKTFMGNQIYSAHSLNYGKNWTISDAIGNGFNPSIALTRDGKAVCSFTNLAKTHICSSFSNFFGESWSDLSTVSLGEFSSLSMSKDGKMTICVCQDQKNLVHTYFSQDLGKNWVKYHNIESGYKPCVAISADGSKSIRVFMDQNDLINVSECPYSVMTVYSKQVKNIYRKDIVNEIFWDGLPEAKLYKIYSDSGLANSIYQGTELKFYEYGIRKNERRIYYVVWIDENGKQSAPVVVSIP